MDNQYKTIDETYRERLKLLIDKYGNQNKLSLAIGKDAGQISQWVNAANTGRNGKARRLSQDTAREIEETLNLPRGWFDQPLTQNNTAEQMQVNNNYGDGQTSNYYNLTQTIAPNEKHSKLREDKAQYLKAMPLLDIDGGIEFALNPDTTEKKIKEADQVATFIPHSSNTFGIKMPDDSLKELSADNIAKGDILIIEPKIQPRHGDLVLVCLNVDDDKHRRGLIARCSLTLDNRYKIKFTEEPALELPPNALICGVIVEIKRRLVPTDTIAARLDKEWDIRNTQNK